ncbi:MAG: hypothetical protein Tsb0020_23810 [Haliangiales bacterium]
MRNVNAGSLDTDWSLTLSENKPYHEWGYDVPQNPALMARSTRQTSDPLDPSEPPESTLSSQSPKSSAEPPSELAPDASVEPSAAQRGAVDQLGVDHVLEQLRDVVEQLEAGQLSLEASLAVYEHGVALARRGHHVLDGAEKRVEQLVRESSRDLSENPAAARYETVPFEHDASDPHGSSKSSV